MLKNRIFQWILSFNNNVLTSILWLLISKFALGTTFKIKYILIFMHEKNKIKINVNKCKLIKQFNAHLII
jgi:hypothetical protein